MKEKTKKTLKGIIDIVGYSSAIGYTGVLGWLIYKTHKYGTVPIASTPFVGLMEILGAGCTVGFLLYKIFTSKSLK